MLVGRLMVVVGIGLIFWVVIRGLVGRRRVVVGIGLIFFWVFVFRMRLRWLVWFFMFLIFFVLRGRVVGVLLVVGGIGLRLVVGRFLVGGLLVVFGIGRIC